MTMWHIYGSQTASPMNEMVEQFNSTVGEEQGIRINVTSVSNSTAIHDALVAAAKGEPGAGELPDLFVCYPKTAIAMGADLFLDWNDYFDQTERQQYINTFLVEGEIDSRQVVFPIAKSAEMLYINTTIFDRFAADSGITYDDLATYEGFLEAAKQYHAWSGGKSFFQYDAWFNYAMVNTISLGGSFFTGEAINSSDPALQRVWAALSEAASLGAVYLNDGYATTAMMTGEIVCGIESTASILYYKDTVTYPDNVSEPLALRMLPVPVFEGATPTVIQRGVGLCALRGDARKEYAAAKFCKWITETQNNLHFVTATGYVPVKNEAFETLFADTLSYQDESYQSLYTAIATMQKDYAFYTPPLFDSYGTMEKNFDEALKMVLRQAAGQTPAETLDALLQKMQ